MQPLDTVPVLPSEHLNSAFLNPVLVFGSQGVLKEITFTLGNLQVEPGVGVVLILVPKTSLWLEDLKNKSDATINEESITTLVKVITDFPLLILLYLLLFAINLFIHILKTLSRRTTN